MLNHSFLTLALDFSTVLVTFCCISAYCKFEGCSGLTSLRVLSVTPCTLGELAFNCGRITLEVPKGSKEAYQNTEVWKDFKEIVEFVDETGIDYLKDIVPSQSIYDINGLIQNYRSEGMRIIRKSNGNSQKVYIK